MLVVQRGGIGAAAEDPTVSLLFRARGDARAEELPHQLRFVGGCRDGAEGRGVRVCGDGVGFAQERDFVGVFGDPAGVDGGV